MQRLLRYTSGVDDSPPEPANEGSEKGADRVYIHSQSGAGSYHIVRQRNDQIEVGRLQTLQDGQPLVGELVQLTQTSESDRLFDVEVLMESPVARSNKGPAQVATGAYRANWDTIFGTVDPNELN
jgi:hypothetical protein